MVNNPNKEPFLEQIDNIAYLKSGFPFLKAGIIKAVNILKEKNLRWKISNSRVREELSQEWALQMPIPQKAVEMCIELLVKIAVGDKSALTKRKELHQKGEPALVVSGFFKRHGVELNMFDDEDRYDVFIDNDILK